MRNENVNTKYQNRWNTTKPVLREEFVTTKVTSKKKKHPPKLNFTPQENRKSRTTKAKS